MDNITCPAARSRLGAFYQCFRQPKSVLRVLGSFRYHYPAGAVKLISDGGLNFKKTAECFGCEFELAENIGNHGTYFSTPSQLESWIKRLVDACKLMTEEYVIILEDDVQVLKPVLSRLDCDLNGINEDARLGDRLTAFLRARNRTMGDASDHYYGGCGGSIIRRAFVAEHFCNVRAAIEEIAPHAKVGLSGPYPSDYYLTALVLYFGGSAGGYEGYYEKGWRDYEARARAGLIEVLHQEKGLYCQPLEPWEAALMNLPVAP